MGQKVSPVGLRLGITEDWKSRWFATKDYSKNLREDMAIRSHVGEKLSRAAISKIEIERAGDRVNVDIYTARPGIVIGRKGAEVNILRAELEKMTDKQVQINIREVGRPEVDASLVAQSVASQLEARVSFRRAMKRAVTAALEAGAQGVKISCAGRLGRAEMARTAWYREGRVPLHTLRANIDYGFAESHTTFGCIGVKVWIYKGDILPYAKEEAREEAKEKSLEEEAKEEVAPEKVAAEEPEEKVEEKVKEKAEEQAQESKAKAKKTGKKAKKEKAKKDKAKKEKTEEKAKKDKAKKEKTKGSEEA